MREKIIGIYGIRNKANNKTYVGSSTDMTKRWRDHKGDLLNNKHTNDYLQKAWNKYGENNFDFLLLERLSTADNLLTREQFYMDSLKSYNRDFGYNLTETANCAKLSQESIDKIKKALTGVPKSPEHVAKTVLTRKRLGLCMGTNHWNYGKHHKPETLAKMRGRKFSDEHRHNISIAMKGKPGPNLGKPMSEETKRKSSETKKKRYASGEVVPWNKNKKGLQVAWNKGKKCPQCSRIKNQEEREKISLHGTRFGVLQMDKQGNIINRYRNARFAAKENGVNDAGIYKACLGYRKTYKGFIWRYDLREDANVENVKKITQG